MASEALTRTGDNISTFKLTPGEHGKFDVIIDGELVGEHKHTPDAHLFPDLQDLMAAIYDRV
jgi:predicted Rdx family selenoprotein